jgi:hypothetical protein
MCSWPTPGHSPTTRVPLAHTEAEHGSPPDTECVWVQEAPDISIDEQSPKSAASGKRSEASQVTRDEQHKKGKILN